MSEMIERVATIIDQIAFKPLPGHGPGECQHCDDDRELTRKRAREIIEAMREPTEAMKEAGFQHTGDPCWQEDVGKAWRAMVDEALK